MFVFERQPEVGHDAIEIGATDLRTHVQHQNSELRLARVDGCVAHGNPAAAFSPELEWEGEGVGILRRLALRLDRHSGLNRSRATSRPASPPIGEAGRPRGSD